MRAAGPAAGLTEVAGCSGYRPQSSVATSPGRYDRSPPAWPPANELVNATYWLSHTTDGSAVTY